MKCKKILSILLCGTIMSTTLLPSVANASTLKKQETLIKELFVEEFTENYNISNEIDIDGLISDLIKEFNTDNYIDINENINERGLGSAIIKKAVKWIKNNSDKIIKVLKKYVKTNITSKGLIEALDIVVGISDTIDDLIYNLVDRLFPSLQDKTVSMITRAIRFIMPF